MSFLDELKEWTDVDAAAVCLGRALGVFSAGTQPTQARAVLLTNNAAGNTLYGMLERLAWLGVLERDEERQRYRALPPRLHPLSEVDDVPSLAPGPPSRSHIELSLEATDGFALRADRAGYRYLARVFEEIADSGVQGGWSFARDERFQPRNGSSRFRFTLVDPGQDDPESPA